MNPKYIIVGGGVVGCSIAYGLLKKGYQVTVLDGGDSANRASRGNFGLVWLSNKGLNAPHYSAWTRRSVNAWRDFADELETLTGDDVHLVQNGGYDFQFSQQEMDAKVQKYEHLKEVLGTDYPYQIWDRQKTLQEEPNIGPDVIGTIFGAEDGHVNPLKLLRALVKAIKLLGGEFVSSVEVVELSKSMNQTFNVTLSSGRQYQSDKLVLAAGLGSAQLGPQLGFKAPVVPQRGQVLITEKYPPILKRPSGLIRQVDEGGIQIGDSKESVGLNPSTTPEMTAAIAERAIAIYPFLSEANIVRSWGALRIISPDGLPIYQESNTCPGAFLVSCHSGITLAASHCNLLPYWFEKTPDSPNLELFSEQRF